jgi:hypothetical protein
VIGVALVIAGAVLASRRDRAPTERETSETGT